VAASLSNLMPEYALVQMMEETMDQIGLFSGHQQVRV
jgi:hypothetical protein